MVRTENFKGYASNQWQTRTLVDTVRKLNQLFKLKHIFALYLK